MTRCAACHRPCVESDAFCRHCGAAIVLERTPFFVMEDWLDRGEALRAAAASAAVWILRVAAHPLLMPYQGGRHEGRMAAFHLVIGLALGWASCSLRYGGARGRRGVLRQSRWALAGLLGGALGWALDFSYTHGHMVDQAIWHVLNWLDPSVDSNATFISFGILQTLRFLGPLALLSLASAWAGRSALSLRILLFSVLALAIRFPLRGFALDGGLIRYYPGQSAIYLASLWAFFYGISHVDAPRPK